LWWPLNSMDMNRLRINCSLSGSMDDNICKRKSDVRVDDESGRQYEQ
jgi:hypothetical protein